jgi:hypothetical protein
MYKRNTEARSRYRCSCEEAMNIVYFECVSVSLVIEHAKRMRMRHITLPTVAQFHKRHDFR